MNNGQTVLITGAASGFGKEFAKIFASEGYSLVLVDKDEAPLRQVAQMVQNNGNEITTIVKDLAQMGAGQEIYNEVQGKTINILVNNAGFGQHGLFVETDWETESDIIHTNVIALAQLTKLFLKDMVARNEGRILQLGSIAAFAPGPNMSIYHATKAFVNHLSEALQYEIKDTNVTMTILAPGASDTNFFATADAENTRVYQDSKLTPAEDVAQAGYKALMSGKRLEVVGFKNEMQVRMGNLMPDSWTAAMMSRLYEEKTAEAN